MELEAQLASKDTIIEEMRGGIATIKSEMDNYSRALQQVCNHSYSGYEFSS